MLKHFVFSHDRLLTCLLLSTVLGMPLSACAQDTSKTTPKKQAYEQVGNLVDFNGVWHNDMGSAATLTVNNGQVSGTYQTNVGAPDKSKVFPLVGTVEGDQISFIVNFKGFGSMTAWVGQLVEGKDGRPTIRTLWHLTKDIKDDNEAKEIWGSVRTGASLFTKEK